MCWEAPERRLLWPTASRCRCALCGSASSRSRPVCQIWLYHRNKPRPSSCYFLAFVVHLPSESVSAPGSASKPKRFAQALSRTRLHLIISSACVTHGQYTGHTKLLLAQSRLVARSAILASGTAERTVSLPGFIRKRLSSCAV